MTAARDPLVDQPWFFTGPARETGEVFAWPTYGGTWLRWSDNGDHADYVKGSPVDGEVVGIRGFAWTVRWTDKALAELARQEAFIAADAYPFKAEMAA